MGIQWADSAEVMGERRRGWKKEEIWRGEERFGARMERRERTEGEVRRAGGQREKARS